MKWAASEELLMAPFELMAATSTSYSALGTKSTSVTLVPGHEMFTVVCSPVLVLNCYFMMCTMETHHMLQSLLAQQCHDQLQLPAQQL